MQNKHIFEGKKYFKETNPTYACTILLRSNTLNPTRMGNNQEELQAVGRLRPKTCQVSYGLGSQRTFGRFLKIWNHSAPGRRWKEWAGKLFLEDSAKLVPMQIFSWKCINNREAAAGNRKTNNFLKYSLRKTLSYFFYKGSHTFLPHTKLFGHGEFDKFLIQKYLFTCYSINCYSF